MLDDIQVINPESDQRGACKENVFLALERGEGQLGAARLYPFFDADVEPEHPHNIYLHLQSNLEGDDALVVKDLLLMHALRRAAEIKHEAHQAKTRIYACFLKHQQEQMEYFLGHGFIHDEGMLILERGASDELPAIEVPQGVEIRTWSMDTERERRRFLAAHREVFPRHAYSMQRLLELMSMPGWVNFTAFSRDAIAGNIILFLEGEDPIIGMIEDLFVRMPWRRSGVAKALLSTALLAFQNLGIQQVRLEMWSANIHAHQLYRMFGFEQIDETELALGRYV